ncbi:hypothetical protein FHX42_000507 [Saccharopolyspora lacisalsi]|uniref:Low molecular weight protein antigen 6 PH domain-containing protein n=1 Tax=Halosaccharopolyspora lacisalsi TaxID=1000566 RepID=A0A839DWP2_9PSEU|nr:PH domain-containing protein [Halosaccharopolyspora lacisalsi]MBA8823178.1 hypothetical protein [Halosaccharopolyspora lacisalsi]
MTDSSAPSTESGTETEPRASGSATADRLPDELTFRITPVSLLGVFTVMICVSPVALAVPWLLTLYALPLLLLVWVLRVRTTVHGGGITARTLFGKSEIAWQDLQFLRLDERRWIRAVLVSGKEIRLPSVRVRDLPRLAVMSGDRVSDPSAEPESTETDRVETDRTGTERAESDQAAAERE